MTRGVLVIGNLDLGFQRFCSFQYAPDTFHNPASFTMRTSTSWEKVRRLLATPCTSTRWVAAKNDAVPFSGLKLIASALSARVWIRYGTEGSGCALRKRASSPAVKRCSGAVISEVSDAAPDTP